MEGEKTMKTIPPHLKKMNNTQCKHEFVYNCIRDELRGTISYVITCRKCFYEPPEGYVPDIRTKDLMKRVQQRSVITQ